MAGVAVLVAVPVTIAIRGGDDPQPEARDAPRVGELEFDRDVGIELRLPEGWKRGREGDAVTFRSRDRSVLVAIAAPGPAADADAIQAAAVSSVRSRYRSASVRERLRGQRLGGRPAQVAAISARHPRTGRPLRILVATARGESFAYLAEVFAAGRNPSESLVEAQALLNNLRLEG